MLTAAGGIIVAPNDTLLIGGSTQSPFGGGPSFAYLLNVDANGHRLHRRGPETSNLKSTVATPAYSPTRTAPPPFRMRPHPGEGGLDAALIRVAL